MARILLAFVFILAQGGAMAETVFVEPDAMPDGADLTYAYPGVVLTVDGEPDTVVRAAVGFSDFNDKNLATTGMLVFQQDPAPLVRLSWDDNNGRLRADFLVPTDFVQIDLICDDDDIGDLRAIDIGASVLESIAPGQCDGRPEKGKPLQFTVDITRNVPDIAYVTAGGIGGEALLLDNFQFRLFTPSCDLELSEDIYVEGDIITASVFRLANTSSDQVPVEVRAWLTSAAMEPVKVSPLRKKIKSLKADFDKDFGPVKLAKVGADLPVGPGEIICRLIDPKNGGAYDVDVAPFEIQ